jgi:hypothetical protein
LTRATVDRLAWTDALLGEIQLPKGTMRIRSGFGSGLSRRAGDPPGTLWAIGDRGPNLKIKTARELYGLDLSASAAAKGAKIMPRLDLGPALAELRVTDDRVELVREMRITDSSGGPVSGLPVPAGPHALSEPALDMEGRVLPPDPSGLDTEGIVALPDGGFWICDEYGPSLVRLDSAGRVLTRIVPEGCGISDAGYPVEARLPAIAARRQLNRGFEAVCLSADGKWLFLAFQSPLAHPDEAAHERARHVRLWRLDAETGAVAAQYLYPLDPPESFRRDCAKGPLGYADLKVSELCTLGQSALLVLERGSETTKIYRVDLAGAPELPAAHLDPATRPTIEEVSGAGGRLPALDKQLVLTTDDHPEIAADLEGMALLSPTELLLVNDNDFGVEGAETGFWLVRFEHPLDPSLRASI